MRSARTLDRPDPGSTEPERPALQPGVILAGRYRLERHLGAGGMGTVWCASDLKIGGHVALKLLANERAGEEDWARLKREIRILRAVEHTHVVRVSDEELTDHGPLIVMELLRGESLRDRLERDRRLSPGDAVPIFLQVVSAVGAAHERGVIHRDIKPANIFLCEAAGGGAHVKVLDFGIAKLDARAKDLDSEKLTRPGEILGTTPYMSPEQALDDDEIDQRTDIWSLGIVFYECLSGILPTWAEHSRQVRRKLALGLVSPLREVAPDLPAPLASLVTRMLSRQPSDRPRDLGEVREALESFATGRVSESAPPTPAPVVVPRPTETLDGMTRHPGPPGGSKLPERPDPGPPVESKPPERPWLRRAGPYGAALVAATVGVVAWISTAERSPQPSPPSPASVMAASTVTATAGASSKTKESEVPVAPSRSGPTPSITPQASPSTSSSTSSTSIWKAPPTSSGEARPSSSRRENEPDARPASTAAPTAAISADPVAGTATSKTPPVPPPGPTKDVPPELKIETQFGKEGGTSER
jgi:eukaryotic-like serine/threonine-protein kinase